MSDQTNPGDDFRGSAADKRKDETVMVNADDLSNLVSNARQEPVAAVPPQPAQPANPPAAAPKGMTTVALVVGIVVAVLVLMVVVIALITFAG